VLSTGALGFASTYFQKLLTSVGVKLLEANEEVADGADVTALEEEAFQ
jgi:hypothetical protein